MDQTAAAAPAVLYVETRPASPEQEEAYNRWYDEVHLPEVCALPGVTAARRYRGADGGYVALYELDAEDPDEVLTTLGAAMADGRVRLTDALQLDPAPVTRVLRQVAAHPSD